MLKYRPKSHEHGHDLGMASGNTTENTLVMSYNEIYIYIDKIVVGSESVIHTHTFFITFLHSNFFLRLIHTLW